MAKRNCGLLQLRMLGIEEEPRREARLDDVGIFDGEEIRMVHVNGVTWWVLADLAAVLGYRDAANAARILREKYKGTHSVSTLGGRQEMMTVNEPGLYLVMSRSNKPSAERFQDWIFEEVLPAIRKYGFYTAGPDLARVMRKINCDPITGQSRIQMTAGYKEFCGALASCGFKAPTHYAMATNTVYASVWALTAKGMRKQVGAARRSPVFDHMTRLALDMQRLMLSLLEEELRARGAEDDAGPVGVQLEYMRVRAAEVKDQLLAIAGPDRALDVVDDPRRGRLWGVIQRQIEGPN
jgi:hypothetical protein